MSEFIVLLKQSHFQIQTLKYQFVRLMAHYFKSNHLQNKPHRSNQAKDYEDEQQLYQVRYSDNSEVKQLKSKLKVLVSKLAANKKEKQALSKQNEELQQEVLSLQNNLRHMVAGFNNTTSQFPMMNELTAKIAQFYKYDCLDTFFDLLGPEELTLKGVSYFYLQTFQVAQKIIDAHFQPAFKAIKAVGSLETLEGPVMNVLRKAFQSKHLTILQELTNKQSLRNHSKRIIDQLGISCTGRQQAVAQVTSFLSKLIQILLQCKICDPPLSMELGGIGKRVQFNSLSHEPFDGFIKNREQCFIILPEVRKRDNGEQVSKCLVLQKDYDLSA